MKYLLCLFLCVAGCDWVPSIIDESIMLPEPIVLDRPEKTPSQPVPAPAPKVEPVKRIEIKTPAVSVTIDPKPSPTRWEHNGHWSYPGSTTDDANRTKLRQHLTGKPHYITADGMTASQVLELHDGLHEAERSLAKTAPKSTVAAPAKVSTITQFTIRSCSICKTDMRDVLPQWRKQGWTILDPVDESDNPRGFYPRYEIRGADGSFRTHTGSLKNWK